MISRRHSNFRSSFLLFAHSLDISMAAVALITFDTNMRSSLSQSIHLGVNGAAYSCTFVYE